MSRKIITTFGELVSNSLVETIASDGQDAQLQWLWKTVGREPAIGAALVLTLGDEERHYHRPGKIDPSVLRAVRFPRKPIPYGTDRELFEALCAVLKKYTSLTELSISLVAFAAMATWLPERSDVPVSLAIVGSRSAERRQLLRLLPCLLRRPLHVADLKLSQLLSLPADLHPSVLIEHGGDISQLRKLLQATSSPEAHIITSGGRLVQSSAPKVICVEDSWSASFPDWPAIEIPLPYAEGPLPVLDSGVQEQIANEFQAKLMMYRMQNYHHSSALLPDLAELSSRAGEIARSLSPCFPGEPELQKRLAAALRAYDQELGKPAENELRSATVEALLQLCHHSGKAKFHVADIAQRVNRILGNRGEFLQLEARSVGTLVRALGFDTDRRDAAGKYMMVLEASRATIHKLATEYNVLARNTEVDCHDCIKHLPYDPEIHREDEVIKALEGASDAEMEIMFGYPRPAVKTDVTASENEGTAAERNEG